MRPFIVTYELTRACHLACSHCRAEAQPHAHPLELRTEESLQLIQEIVALQPALLVFTGGDPSGRAALDTISKRPKSCGRRPSSIQS